MSETKQDETAVEQEEELEEEIEDSTNEPAEDEEFSLDPKEDPRARIYDGIDKKRGVHQIPQEEDQTDEDDETEDTASTTDEEKAKDDQTAEGDGTGDEGDPFEGKVMTQEDFLKAFGDVKVKAKIAGEEVEVTPGELLKVTGLERHMTKRLQVISKREAEVLKKAEGRSPVSDVEGDGPTEDEVRQKYDELYEASPYEAQRYLDKVKADREDARVKAVQAQVDADIKDFKDAYPECTDQEWQAMNDPAFWNKHEDIVKLRDSGDVFSTLVTAYSRLQQTKVKIEEGGKEKVSETTTKKTERKKQGQVVRTSVKPVTERKGKEKPTMSKKDMDRAYILSLRKKAAGRMNIPQ